jgi:hypothetical protein
MLYLLFIMVSFIVLFMNCICEITVCMLSILLCDARPHSSPSLVYTTASI